MGNPWDGFSFSRGRDPIRALTEGPGRVLNGRMGRGLGSGQAPGGEAMPAIRVRGWAEQGLVDSIGPIATDPASLLESIFDLSPGTWLRRMPGRETFHWPGKRHLVVKRFLTDETRDRWYERLHLRSPRSPARREAENLAALGADGIGVPGPLAWVEEIGPMGGVGVPGWLAGSGRSALIMCRVRHSGHLGQRMEAGGAIERRLLIGELHELVTRLHRRGWFHRDLYMNHLVFDESATGRGLVLLDAGRSRLEQSPARRWFVKDLAALFFSAPACVSRTERLRFLREWMEASGRSGPESRRRWVRAILRKSARIAAHIPKSPDEHHPGDTGQE